MPANAGFHSSCLMKITMNNYTLQYWNQRDAEWRNAGFKSDDRTAVARKMRDDRDACGDCVRFRIIDTSDPLAGLSAHEYEHATCPV